MKWVNKKLKKKKNLGHRIRVEYDSSPFFSIGASELTSNNLPTSHMKCNSTIHPCICFSLYWGKI